MRLRDDKSAIAKTAAGIFGAAALVGLVEAALPGGPEPSVVPGVAALALALLIVLAGPRLPRAALMPLGPLGAALIGVALATTHDYGDGAVLYMWPVLWMAYFFGVRGTVFIVVWVGLVHAIVLFALPPGMGNADRFIDVIVSVSVVGAVTRFLAARNEALLSDLRAEARVDSLTGLLNRRGFGERLDIEVARAIREEEALAVVAFDLDHFKRVNDACGHEVGDRVLAWIGSVIARGARATDVAARVGGEEFVVVLSGSDCPEARAFAERVRREVQAGRGRGCFGVSDGLELTISAGVASSDALVEVQDLLDEADRALYAAKRAGRNRVEVALERDVPEREPARHVRLEGDFVP